MTAYEINGEVYLTFVKVLDEITYGFVDEDEPVAEPADRDYWEKKSSKKSLSIVDKVLDIIKPIEPSIIPKYNRHYIGLSLSGSPFNFVNFRPQKGSLVMKFKLSKMNEYDEMLEEAGFETLPYETVWKQYRVRIEPDISEKQQEVILDLAKAARSRYKGSD